MPLNVEIKARCSDPEKIRQILKEKKAEFKGIDQQTDTYFNTPNGRLKLREGNIENNLIFYQRSDQAGPKESTVHLYKTSQGTDLKNVLQAAMGAKVVVKKAREIIFIENVKFHIDSVEQLGHFIEIEAIDKDGSIGKEKLYEQCQYFLEIFGIKETDLLEGSYSDMLGAI